MEIALNKGLMALYAGDLNQAESYFTEAADMHPTDYRPYFYRGKVREQTGQLKAAILDFERTLSINPNHNQSKIALERANRKMNPLG